MNEKNLKLLGAILQSEREKKELSQLQVAQKLHVTKSLISKVENGQVRVPVFRLVQYCMVLGIHLIDISSKIEGILSPPPRINI